MITATTQLPPPTTTGDATRIDLETTTTTTTTTTTIPTTIATNDVGTGLAPGPAADASAIVAQGGPVLSTVGPSVGSAANAGLPVTGPSMELPLGSGVALALVGAALLRLRRRPSWD